MKTIDVQQGTPAWLEARLGIPTASCFDKILTAKGLKPSASQAGYRAQLVAEWYLGQPLESFGSGFTERGTGMEAEAARAYAFDYDADVFEVGFCLTDDGVAGCSPDRLVGDDGLLEIKCPSAHVHMGYFLNGFDDYALQVQGQLWVTSRKWVDKFSYHPSIPCVRVRIERDEKVIAAIDAEVRAFAESVEQAKTRLPAPVRPEPVAVGDDPTQPF